MQQTGEDGKLGQLGRAALAPGEMRLDGWSLLRVDDSEDQDAE